MKKLLNNIYKHQVLTEQEAFDALIHITNQTYSEIEIAAFLSAFNMRSITVEELNGFRKAMLQQCVAIDLDAFQPMDVCGTGGDGKNTFNISTATAFVLAGAGIPIAKHGNYGVSSVSGSSNVMEHLGISFTNDTEKLNQQMKEANLCFLHAPLFHPAMKNVGAIRKQLATKTFFNLLGPLTNPAQPKVQMVGLFHLQYLRLYQYLFQSSEVRYSIIHALDGYDEISLTADTKVIFNTKEEVFSAHDFGFEKVQPHQIFGGNTVEEAAYIFEQILKGKGTKVQNQVVLANAAIGYKTYKPETDLKDAVAIVTASLFEGKALEKLTILKELQ